MEEDGSYHHNADMPYYGLKSPWTSAVSQALAAIAFIEHGECELAKKSLDYMIKNHMSPSGSFILEKGDQLIYNGWMIALLALHKYVGEFHDTNYELIFDKQIGKLARLTRLGLFTTKSNWTYYDWNGQPASKFYHELHKELYTELQEITGRLPNMVFGDSFPKFSWICYLVKKHHIKMLPMYLKWRKWK